MKLSLSIAQKLLLLQNGKKLPACQLKYAVIDDMLDNGILYKEVQGRSRARIFISDPNTLTHYLRNHFGIHNLADYVIACRKEELSRTEAIEVSSNSKLKRARTFEGFLVNSYQPIKCVLDDEPVVIHPAHGTFIFIYNYKNFVPPSNVTIVGVENADNFSKIERQKYLFSNITPLFISRYPQNQNKDLLNWLRTIPNNYLHFGDFDFSGLNIYWNEYKKHLRHKSRFFVPEQIEQFIASKGNRKLYDYQQVQFKEDEIDEVGIEIVLKYIRKHKKGLEQEIFIQPMQ